MADSDEEPRLDVTDWFSGVFPPEPAAFKLTWPSGHVREAVKRRSNGQCSVCLASNHWYEWLDTHEYVCYCQIKAWHHDQQVSLDALTSRLANIEMLVRRLHDAKDKAKPENVYLAGERYMANVEEQKARELLRLRQAVDQAEAALQNELAKLIGEE